MRIITGSTGSTHVTSNDDGCYNQAVWGANSIVLSVGEKLAASIVDNNTIKLKDGDLLLQGRHARINPGVTEDVDISTGSVGNNRNDLIVARYKLDEATGHESIELKVIEGTETTGSATDPTYNTGDIRTGSMLVDFPLYRVKITGVNISSIDKLFTEVPGVSASIDTLKGNVNTINGSITSINGSITTINENLTQIENNMPQIKVIEFLSTVTSVDYPTGFTKDNCSFLNIEGYYSPNSSWYSDYESSGNFFIFAHVGLENNNVSISKAPAISTSLWTKFRITLVKYK